jgi:hypothetical protein
MILNYRQAHRFVNRNGNARWDGWNIVLFIKNPRGFMHKNGRFDRRTSSWGFEKIVRVNTQGQWVINSGRAAN